MRVIPALTLISCAFHASAAVLAHRSSEHHSRLLDPAKRSGPVKYTSPFAGAVLNLLDQGDSFYQASATIKVPQLFDSPQGGLSVVVSIDMLDNTSSGNDTPCNGTLSVGVDIVPIQNGTGGSSNLTHKYTAWYYGGPGSLYYNFPDFTVSPGDDIQLSVNMSSATSGIAVAENLATAQTASKDINTTGYLCGLDVGWTVNVLEGYPIAHFGELIFFGATATGIGDHIYTPADAASYEIYDIYQAFSDTPGLQVTSTETQGIYLIVRDFIV